MALREYQVNAIQECRYELSAGHKRVVIYSPTGSGKSVIAEELAVLALAKGKRVAIIANRVQLVQQMAERFTNAKISYGILQGQNTVDLHHQVVICSIATVAKRGLPDTDFIIVDEAHACAGSKHYRELMFKLNNVPVLGLTATPFSKGMAKKYDELAGEPLFQAIVVAETIRGLIDQGYLVDCEIYAPSEPDLSGVRMQRNAFGEMDYAESALGEAVDKPALVGDIIAHWHKLAEGKPTIVFATTIAHSQHIVSCFEQSGVTARHIDCYMEEQQKQDLLNDFKAGKFTVLSNVALVAEGFDYPACEVMVLARPTKSLIRYIQMAGRVLRIHHGKERGLILDHSGSVKDLGFPTDDLPLELDDGTAKTASKKEIEEPKPKKCPKCSYMKPPKCSVCPKCGHKPERQNEIEHADGDLVKIAKKPKINKDDKQQVWSECLGLAKQKNKTTGWASHLYKSITGVFPRSLNDVPRAPSFAVIDKEHSNRIAYAKRMEKTGGLNAARP
jgi:DNA repair protein RadD